MTECTHTKHVPGYWQDRADHDPEEWECGGYDLGPHEYIEGYDEQTVVDIDTHRYKCTQCNKVFYYSERARQMYEGAEE